MRRLAVVTRPAWINFIAGSGPERKSPVSLPQTWPRLSRRVRLPGSPDCAADGSTGGPMASAPSARTAARSLSSGGRTMSESSPTRMAGPSGWCSETPPRRASALLARMAATWGRGCARLRERTGQPWRVLNLSVSGALIRDVLAAQVPAIPPNAQLVTCGIGANDILFSAPGKLFSDLRALLAVVPDGTVILDLPLPQGFWWLVGRCSRAVHQPGQPGHPRGCRSTRGFPSPRCRPSSRHRGRASSRWITSIPARTATGTGRVPCWPRSRSPSR